MDFQDFQLAITKLRVAQAEWLLAGAPGGAATGLRFAETATALTLAALRPIAAKYPLSVAGWLAG